MRFLIKSKVYIKGIGTLQHEHKQEFADDSNVFGRVLEYRQYMYKTFHCTHDDFELISAKQIQ